MSAEGVVRIGVPPQRVGGGPWSGRTPTSAELAALRGDGLDDEELSDLKRAGWTFREYRPADAKPVEPAGDGPMLSTCKADLALLDLTAPGKRSLAQLAMFVAEVIDDRGAEGGTSTVARLAQEFRATMVALTARQIGGDTDSLAELLRRISTPDAGKPAGS